VTETRLMVLEQDGQARATRLRELVGRVAALGWLDGATSRAVVHVGSCGRSALAVETAMALTAALRERAPGLRADALDTAASGSQWNGFGRLSIDRADAVVVRGPRGVALHVPKLWFEPFFLITVAAVRPNRRWRIGGVLQAQAEILGHLNPGAPTGLLLSEAHRLGASDLAVACGTHAGTGDWWVASPSDVLAEGAVARAAGIDPRDLPGVRTIARHELVASWEAVQGAPDVAPDLRDVAAGSFGATILAAREQGIGAGRRTIEDVGLIARNLRKVPQALRRRLSARAGKRKSA